jgi:hypothetical protein
MCDFEDDVFVWRKRSLEDAMTPTGFEGMSAVELLTPTTLEETA